MILYPILAMCLVIGLLLFFVGLLGKTKDFRVATIGLYMAGLPIGIGVLSLVGDAIVDHSTFKPNATDLVGTYHIVKVTNLEIDERTYRHFTLQFFDSGRFSLTPTPYIDVCDSGTYEVDYLHDDNELTFACNGGFVSSHIDRWFGSYRIEFIIGDPDSRESIFFGRDDN